MDIRNIYCAGRNYSLHAKELGNEIPQEPIIFLKPSHAARLMDEAIIHVPGGRGAVHYEVELVLRIDRPYEPGMEADRGIGAIALGIDLTLREVQSRSTGSGLPWLDAKGFPSSALLTDWMPYPGADALTGKEFALLRNGEEVQRGHSGQMLFSISELYHHIGSRFGLASGDVIYTGTPAGVGALSDGDLLECVWENRVIGSSRIELEA